YAKTNDVIHNAAVRNGLIQITPSSAALLAKDADYQKLLHEIDQTGKGYYQNAQAQLGPNPDPKLAAQLDPNNFKNLARKDLIEKLARDHPEIAKRLGEHDPEIKAAYDRQQRIVAAKPKPTPPPQPKRRLPRIPLISPQRYGPAALGGTSPPQVSMRPFGRSGSGGNVPPPSRRRRRGIGLPPIGNAID